MRAYLCCGLLALPGMLLANGGGYIQGVKSTGAFQPMGIDQVEMLSEKLDIDLHIEYADVRIEYVLHNPGKKVKIEAGFPSAIHPGYTEEDPENTAKLPRPKLEQLVLTLDGKKLTAKDRPDDLKLGEEGMIVTHWHVFDTTFEAEQTRRLVVSYRAPYSASFDSTSDDLRCGSLDFTYLFSAAALWAGPIKTGTVSLHAISVKPEDLVINHAKKFQRNGNTLTWNFSDFEPTLEDDLLISARPAYREYGRDLPTGEYVDYRGYGAISLNEEKPGRKWELRTYLYDAKATSTLKSDANEYSAEMVKDMDRETAWVEGVPGNGEGETLTLTLKKPAKVQQLAIANGYTKSEKLYFANSRASKLNVRVNEGEWFTVLIPDERLENEWVYIDLPNKDLIQTIELKIAGAYPGTKYQDTAISDLQLVMPLSKAPKIQPAR